MGDIRNLETRLIVAFDRIGRGVETWDMQRASAAVATTVDDSSALEQMAAALKEERLANEQLDERVRTLKSRSDDLAHELSAAQVALETKSAHSGPTAEHLAEVADTMARQEAALAQLRQAGEALRANNDALREANAQGVGDADLINAALKAQVAHMAAERVADRLEIDGLLMALRPLLEAAKTSSGQTGEDDA